MQCLTPFQVKDLEQEVPCGKCYHCLRRRIGGWIFRINNQLKHSAPAFFVTLTYDTEHVPITANGYMTLKKSDLQNFFRILRKQTGKKIKYYAVGEYGENKHRPHYHAILMGATQDEIKQAWRTKATKKVKGEAIGEIHFGDTQQAAIEYCFGYLQKGCKIPMHRKDDRQPKFQLFSKRLGLSYINERTRAWHLADLENRMYMPVGQDKFPMPRYFKEKLYTPEQREIIQAKQIPEGKKRLWEYMQKIVDQGHSFDDYIQQLNQMLSKKNKSINNQTI